LVCDSAKVVRTRSSFFRQPRCPPYGYVRAVGALSRSRAQVLLWRLVPSHVGVIEANIPKHILYPSNTARGPFSCGARRVHGSPGVVAVGLYLPPTLEFRPKLPSRYRPDRYHDVSCSPARPSRNRAPVICIGNRTWRLRDVPDQADHLGAVQWREGEQHYQRRKYWQRVPVGFQRSVAKS